MKTQITSHLDVYSIVTDRIIKQLEQGTVPWKQPWTDSGIPQNGISRRHYRGINVWLLATLNYSQNLFLTWKQVKELGGSVRKGEQSHIVVFTRWIERKSKNEADTEKVRKVPFLRYYKVFNVSQCDGLPTEKIPILTGKDNAPIESCEAIYATMPNAPVVRYEYDNAFYHGKDDYVNMPRIERFISSDSYYGTLFHELIHSTGHPRRLDRKQWLKETSYATSNEDRYSLEELVAEMGASYLESLVGIVDNQFQQHAGYIESWLKTFRGDKRFVVIAAALAQQATDYILNVKVENQPDEIAIAS